MKNTFRIFHSEHEKLRERVHIVLVRPEQSGNVGSVARAMANMGIRSPLLIVGTPEIITEETLKFAKHARIGVEQIVFYQSLDDVFLRFSDATPLFLATTARAGSASRPHPLRLRDAVQRSFEKLVSGTVSDIVIVFGPEGDGLLNHEVAKCEWVVTIPSSEEYSSLNLAHAVMVTAYEFQNSFIEAPRAYSSVKPSEKERLIENALSLAEEVGFVLPTDPHKMRPRLEKLMEQLPPHIEDVRTLHGFIGQIRRSIQRGEPDYRGRYRHWVEHHSFSGVEHAEQK